MFDTSKSVRTTITNKGFLIKYLPIYEKWDDTHYYSSFLGFNSKEKIIKKTKNYIKTIITSFHFFGIPIPFFNGWLEIEVNLLEKKKEKYMFKSNFLNISGYFTKLSEK